MSLASGNRDGNSGCRQAFLRTGRGERGDIPKCCTQLGMSPLACLKTDMCGSGRKLAAGIFLTGVMLGLPGATPTLPAQDSGVAISSPAKKSEPDGKVSPSLVHIIEPHARGLCPLAFSPDGKSLATGGAWTVHLWTLAGNAKRAKWKSGWGSGWINAVAFSPDGTILAAGCDGKIVTLYEAPTGKLLRQLEVPKFEVPEIAVDALAFSPGGTILAAAGRRNRIYLWDPANGRLLHCLDKGKQGATWCGRSGLAFSPDGNTLATSGAKVNLWDVITGKQIQIFKGEVNALAFAPEGNSIIGGGGYPRSEETGCIFDDQHFPSIYLWEVATGKERQRARWGSPREAGFAAPLTATRFGNSFAAWGVVTALALSPDGKILVSGGPDRTRIWDVAMGRQLGTLEGRQGANYSVAFSPNGQLLATSNGDNKICVWNVAALLAQNPHGEGRFLPPNPPPPGELVTFRVGSPPGALELPSSPPQLEARWADLASTDAPRAYRAIGNLVRWPDRTIPFLMDRFQSLPRAGPQRMAQLIKELDSDQFSVRRRAREELEELEELAEPALKKALASSPSQEVRRQVEALHGRLGHPITTPNRLRAIRSVEVLERIGNAAAKRLLETLAKGSPGAELTEDAKAALARLSRRPSTRP